MSGAEQRRPDSSFEQGVGGNDQTPHPDLIACCPLNADNNRITAEREQITDNNIC